MVEKKSHGELDKKLDNNLQIRLKLSEGLVAIALRIVLMLSTVLMSITSVEYFLNEAASNEGGDPLFPYPELIP